MTYSPSISVLDKVGREAGFLQSAERCCRRRVNERASSQKGWIMAFDSWDWNPLCRRQTNLCTVPQSSLYDLFLQLGLHGHSSPPRHLFTTCETEILHLYSTYGFFYVTNISIINPKMPLIFNQALKFIPFESALNNNKRATQVRNTEKYQWVLK